VHGVEGVEFIKDKKGKKINKKMNMFDGIYWIPCIDRNHFFMGLLRFYPYFKPQL